MKRVLACFMVVASLSFILCPLADAGLDLSKPSFSNKEVGLILSMRRLFTDCLNWQRVFAVETFTGAPDAIKAQARLMSNQDDIGNTFKQYFDAYSSDQISSVFKQFTQLQCDYAVAIRNSGDKGVIVNKMQDKSDELAGVLSVANMNWMRNDLSTMLRKYCDLITKEMDLQSNGFGVVDAAVYDATFDESVEMADTFSSGIIKQFPAKFW
jgi:hypothetical protein